MATKLFIFFVFLAIKFFGFLYTLVSKLENRQGGGLTRHEHRPRRSETDFEDALSARSNLEVTAVGVARRLDGRVDQVGDEFEITFHRFGLSFTAFLSQRLQVQTIRVVTNWPENDFRLRIFPDGPRQRGDYRGVDDIEVGFRQFDRDFVVQSNHPEYVLKVIDKKTAKQIRKHRKRAWGRIDIDIAGGVIKIGGKSSRILKLHQILAIIESFTIIYSNMIDSYEVNLPTNPVALNGLDIVYLEKRTAICMVCGMNVQSQGVSCVKCKTRHHRDCWEYIGKCSTYACRSRKAN